MKKTLSLLTLFSLTALLAPGEAAERKVTAKNIRHGIDGGLIYLKRLQKRDGSIGERSVGGREYGGLTSLSALAMLAAGRHPTGDPALAKALSFLAKLKPEGTYTRGIRANVWEYALRGMPQSKKYRSLLKADYDWLLEALGAQSGWRYTKSSRDWDNSCTQYGVLGLWAASRAGFDPGEKIWSRLSKHFQECQNKDGGWGYVRNGSTPNMATAGLATLFLVYDKYHAKAPYSRQRKSGKQLEAQKVLKSLNRGLQWLAKREAPFNSGYFLYGMERTGVASGRRFLGKTDWFYEGARVLLNCQRANGGVPLGAWGGEAGNTAFAVLFLVYGGAPLAFQKLEFGDDQDWNRNPRDVANLTKDMWSAYERPLNWQKLSIKSELRDFEAPILILTGTTAPVFTKRDVRRLKQYILGGGTIFAEPSDFSPAFLNSMKGLLGRMFPQESYPSYQWSPLSLKHDVFQGSSRNWKKAPKILGASDGQRTFFFLSENYYSADWQSSKRDCEAFQFAKSLLFYATDKGRLKPRFHSILPFSLPRSSGAGAIKVARVKFQGTKAYPADWDRGALVWQRVAPYVKHRTGRELEEIEAVELGRSSLKGVDLLHITGQEKLSLSKTEKQALRAYVRGGGTVLVDAFHGSELFAKSSFTELTAVFGSLKKLKADSDFIRGRRRGSVVLGFDIEFKSEAWKVLFERTGEGVTGPQLFASKEKDRIGVIYSEFDLSASMAGIVAYKSRGYREDSARRIIGNLMNSLGRGAKDSR